MKTYLSVFFAACLSVSMVQAETMNAPLMHQVEGAVADLMAAEFISLKDIQIEYKPIQSSAVFFATDINIGSLILGPRQYVLYVNQDIIKNPMDAIAMKGILAHELTHFNDYENMNVLELAVFYARILMDGDFEAQYERHTDEQAFDKGFYLGIKSFRHWLYARISKEEKALKAKNYYTPAEIDHWMLDHLSTGDVTLL